MRNTIRKILLEYKNDQDQKDYNKYKKYIGNTWFHGTNKKITRFSLNNLGDTFNSSILGLYFTSIKNPPPYSSSASEYANYKVSLEGGEPYVHEIYFEPKKPLIINSNGWYSPNAAIDAQKNDIKRWIKNDNYDSIISFDFDDPTYDQILVILDVNNIKIKNIEKVR